jgi:hypothetical protein
MITWLFIVSWFACGVLSYGITLAYFQRNWPTMARKHYSSDVRLAICMGIIGPMGAVFAYCRSHRAKHGLQFRREKVAGSQEGETNG